LLPVLREHPLAQISWDFNNPAYLEWMAEYIEWYKPKIQEKLRGI
jgi:hypothetical protein